MIRTLQLTVVLILALGAPALAMNKGTVKFFNEAKGFGRAGVVVIEPGGSPELSPGETVVISGKSVTGLAVGDIVSFDQTCDVGCGAEPANLKVFGKALVIDGKHQGRLDLRAGPGEVVMLQDAGIVRGSIDLQGGALLLVGATTFDGSIDSRDGSFVLVDSGATIGGKLDSRDAAALILRGDVTGHLRSKGDDYLLLQRASHHYVGTVTIVK